MNVRQDPGFVVTTMASGTWETVKALGTMPVKLYHVGRASLGLEKRDQNGPMSVVGAGRVAGEILVSADQVPAADRFFTLLLLLAGLNLFLAMFNLVPLPPLDGGPMATTVYEARAPRLGPAARPARPRLRRQRQAPARHLRDGRRDPGDERGADLRRHRRSRLTDLNRRH